MKEELYHYYESKRIKDYKGYRLVTYENTKSTSLKKYAIVVYRDNKNVGTIEADNEKLALTSIKERIDKAESRGGRLDYLDI